MRYAFNLLLTGLTSLFLLGCATSPASDGRHGSDLAALESGINALLPERRVSTRAEDVATTGQAWNLLLDHEDVNYLHNRDKQLAKDFVTQAIEHIQASRRPCTWWHRLWNLRECR